MQSILRGLTIFVAVFVFLSSVQSAQASWFSAFVEDTNNYVKETASDAVDFVVDGVTGAVESSVNTAGDVLDFVTGDDGSASGAASTESIMSLSDIRFTADKSPITPGSSTTLVWGAGSTWNCALNNMGEVVAMGATGSWQTPALYTQTSYRLSCSNSTTEDTQDKQLTVAVSAAVAESTVSAPVTQDTQADSSTVDEVAQPANTESAETPAVQSQITRLTVNGSADTTTVAAGTTVDVAWSATGFGVCDLWQFPQDQGESAKQHLLNEQSGAGEIIGSAQFTVAHATIFKVYCKSSVASAETSTTKSLAVLVENEGLLRDDADVAENDTANATAFTFGVEGGKTTVQTGEHFVLTWTSDRAYCVPSGAWSLDDVRAQNINMVRDLFGIGLALQGSGRYEVSGVTESTTYNIVCQGYPLDPQKKTALLP